MDDMSGYYPDRPKATVIIPGGQRAAPPPELTAQEAKFWVQYMSGMPSGWFGCETFPLLQALCRYAVMAENGMAVVNSTPATTVSAKEYRALCAHADRAMNMVLKISYQLQLTPKSRGEYHSSRKDETNSRVNPVRPWEIAVGERNGKASTP
jgi:hypothetical protein